MRAQSAASVGEVRGADAASRNPFCRSNTSLTGPRSLAVHTRRICFPLWTLTVLRSDNEKRFLKKLTGQGKDAERVTLPIIINNTFRALSFPLPGNAEGGQRPQCSNRPTPRSQLLCRPEFCVPPVQCSDTSEAFVLHLSCWRQCWVASSCPLSFPTKQVARTHVYIVSSRNVLGWQRQAGSLLRLTVFLVFIHTYLIFFIVQQGALSDILWNLFNRNLSLIFMDMIHVFF